ncbi:predicted protein [Thalassiosira pseudonana CCMP1335]|uniref:Pherophorin domain-containing protein n=1 Tax=Thalassiosira pseudonana TaxID=35128 RepID=B8LBN4_THAPS|nr:predicted protein [Thalassiosira pseudonana CCMP1335]EED87213.1 predicted protein [Thalassiosira pseudonana CCMP1335]|eukprot:g5679.t1 g5679   contig2:1048741-1049944(+)
MTSLLLTIATLLLNLTPTTHAQSTTTSNNPYSCIDPLNLYTTEVRKGENTTVCLYVGPDGDWNSDISYKRFSVNLVADEFSSYRIPGSFNDIVSSNPFGSDATHIFASSQTALSFLRRYYDTTTQHIYPYLTAIIDVRDGLIRGIAWDDACVFCQKSRCLSNTYNFNGAVATKDQISQPTDGCYLTRNECVTLHAGGSDECDLKLFVVWTGTAVGGKVLLSSDSRFSAFPPNRIQENVKNGVDSALGNLNDFKNTVSGGISDAVDAAGDVIPGR